MADKKHLVGLDPPPDDGSLIGFQKDEEGNDLEASRESAFQKFTQARGETADSLEEDTEDAAAEETESGGSEPEEKDSTEGGPDADTLQRARTALLRDKAPKDIIERLEKGDKETLQYALQRADAQAEVDRLAAERSRLLNPNDPINKGKDQSAESSSAQAKPTEPAPDATLDKALKGLMDAYGDDSPEVSSFQALRQDRDAQKQELESLAARVAAFEQSEDQRISAQQRQRLTKLHPDLKEDGAWKRVWETAGTLPKTGRYQGLPDLDKMFDDAAMLSGFLPQGAPSGEPGGSELESKSDPPEKNGSVERSTRGSNRKKANERLTPRERAYKAFQAQQRKKKRESV